MESSGEDIKTKKTHSNYPSSGENSEDRETHATDVHHIVESDPLDCKIGSREIWSSKDESFKSLNMENKGEKIKNHREKKCDLQPSNAMVDEQQGLDILCNYCFRYEKEQVAATSFCKTCENPDPMCEACSKYHIRQELSKSHKICGDIDKFPKSTKYTSHETKLKTKHVCVPCLNDDIEVKATHFCQTCKEPEPLCETCAKHHTRQKLTKGHKMCEDMADFPTSETNHGQETKLCFPCSNDDIEVKATHFCQTCKDPEPLCETCAKHHTRQKLTKGHKMCADMADFPTSETNHGQETKLCFPCSNDDIEVKATHFCQTCKDPEPLCETCAKHHTRQKLTKGHKMCADMAGFPTFETNLGQNTSLKTKHVCYLCSNDDTEVKATHFCQTCKDPEPLCETCAKHHTRQKFTKGHKMSADMADFPTSETNHGEITPNEKEMKCYPCLNDFLKIKATHFCETCEDPEPLCKSCAKQHTRQKIAKDHDICADMAKFPKPFENVSEKTPNENECYPCSRDSLKIKASSFCKTCDDPEPLCEACAKQHTRQKIAKDHEISRNMAELSKCHPVTSLRKTENNGMVCNPCFGDNVETKATHFCKTCEDPEPFCETCAKQHTRQKMFKEHTLSTDLRDFCKKTNEMGKTNDNGMVCNPCFGDNVETKATHFCKTCEDPEPFCETCAKQHTRQKMFKEHTLSTDLWILCKQTSEMDSSEINPFDNCVEEEVMNISIPGIPSISKIVSDTVYLYWQKSESKVDYYQIRYKRKNGDEKWKFAVTDADQSEIVITGLMANTKYVFQVRGVYQDQEGSYGPSNDDIQTPESLATKLLEFSNRIDNGDPSINQLLATELQDSRNTTAKTRKLVLGDDRSRGGNEKTIMLVGATGSGKSTLVDGIVNYVMGVSFDDPFRFTLVQLEEEEKKIHNQAVSQTEWITVYKIAPQKGGRLNYTLNIIDTPGFGDTRGIDRDQCTISQIRHLFSAEFPKGVLYIDAVCFIVKAPDARLTVSQKYIFSSIMALFGKDIESNICTLITFADGAEPPVLASLKEANLPFGSTFEFNNSALFAANKNLAPTSLSSMFWDMGCKSFQKFFDEICHFETRSLAQTKDVLKEREQLKTVLESIYPQVKAGLSKLSELRNQLDAFQRNRNDIENNKDFEYEVEETKQIKVELKPGEHVTNCLRCNITCHERCAYADDDQKKNCCAMNNGYCTVCIKKCIWSEHKNTRYIFRYTTEKVRKTYTEMKEKYEKAKGVKMTHQTFIEGLTRDVDHLFFCVKQRMREMKRCKSRLEVIALRPDPLSTVEHLDLMIQAEEMEKQPGYEQRIKVLNEFRHMALIDKDFENFDEEIQLTKQEMASYGIESAKKEGNIFERGFDYIKDFFSPYSSTTPNIQQKRNKKNKKKV